MSVLIQLALLGDAAWACTCIGTRVGFVSPAENATDVPRNAVFRLFMYNGFPVSEYHIVENGVERTDTEQSYRDFGPHNMVEVRLDEPYAPDSVVQVFADDDETPGLTFHVGDQIDDTPPEWGGEFDVVSRIEDFGTCGKYRHHDFSWLGASDDEWPMDELIFVLEPLEDEMNPTMGWGNDVSIEHYLCDKDDPSLEKRFHRKYEVYVEDGSGNRSEAFVVGTGRGCGCWSAPASPGAVALLALLGAAGMRRRD